MKISTSLLSASLIFSLAVASSLPAETAFNVTYDFTGTPIENPTTSTGNISSGSMAWTGFTTQFGFSSSSDSAYVRTDQTGTSLNLGQYVEFTLDATGGEFLNMDSITFSFGGSSNAAAREGNVYSVLRAGAPDADFSSLPDLSLTPGPTTVANTFISENNTVYTTFTADLSSSTYQNIASLTFRFYVYDEVNSGNVYLRFNDFTASGTTAIPETNTSALLSGIAVLLFVALYRRRLRR